MSRLPSLTLVLVAVLGCGNSSSGSGSPGQTFPPDARPGPDVGLGADDAGAMDGSGGLLDAATERPDDVAPPPAADGPSPVSDAQSGDARPVDVMPPGGPYLVEGL